jgi:TonB family protein
MTSNKMIVGVLALLAFMGWYSSARDEQTPDTQQLLNSVHKISDLTLLGPYVLTARIVINPGDNKREQAGTLVISRDHDLSRVELKIGGTDEVQIHRNHVSYIVPSQSLLPESGLTNFDKTWDPSRSGEIEIADKYKLGKAHAESIGENRAWCFDKKTEHMKSTLTEKLCIDASRPVLLRRSVSTTSREEFMDYAQVGTQQHPQKVSILRGRMAHIEVTDIHIATAVLSEELFKPPEDAIEVESCANERAPEPIHTPEPSFPERASKDSKRGMVVLDVIVAKDGTIALARSVTPDDYGFSQSAERTVRTWRFKPAVCSGHPVATEMNVEVFFDRF